MIKYVIILQKVNFMMQQKCVKVGEGEDCEKETVKNSVLRL